MRIQTDFLQCDISITQQHTCLHQFLCKIDDPGTGLDEWPDDV